MSLVFKSSSKNIWFNLALEQKLLKLAEKEPLLYIWQNDKCVVIGKYQNAFVECNLENMEKDSVKLARRMSGGGAVYQDLGNLCFTVAGRRENFKYLDKMEVVLKALRASNLKVERSGRNDIILEGKKISGSAFQLSDSFVSYHGTMLFNVDFSAMGKYLTPSKIKLESKGVKSVSARVVNIQTIKPDFKMKTFEKTLIDEFVLEFGSCKKIITYGENYLEDIKDDFQHFSDKNWIYSKVGEFPIKVEIKFEDFLMQLNLSIAQGRVKEVKIFSDTLEEGTVEELEKSLINISYNKESFEKVLLNLKKAQSKKTMTVLLKEVSFY
ncbi:MAG: lipoate--protein ligase [Sphaerochaetaceae bacterium]|nr:lipoate--protein ligase [Sphaerochaetaceae bacterium]